MFYAQHTRSLTTVHTTKPAYSNVMTTSASKVFVLDLSTFEFWPDSSKEPIIILQLVLPRNSAAGKRNFLTLI
jgi:hypothetical protein